MNKKCKSCKADIDAKATKCSHCGTDQRNWFARHKIITGVLVIIIVFGIIGAAGSSKSGTSVPAASDKSNVGAGGSTQTTAAPTKAPQTLLNITGSGTKSTQKFTAGGDWDLNWTYDCSNFGNQGNFQVYVYNGDGTMSFQNAGVNQLGNKDSGVEHYHNGGTFYLEVNSECSWTVNAQG